MKKLMMIAITLLTLTATAQNKPNGKELLKDLSAEEIASLKTKKMTLHLDLTESQQVKINALMLDEAIHIKKRKAKFDEREKNTKKPSKEDRLAMVNELLDRQIVLKKRMRDILNDEQFEKWNDSFSKRNKMKQKRKHKEKPNGRQ